jgi:hypothetical protein
MSPKVCSGFGDMQKNKRGPAVSKPAKGCKGQQGDIACPSTGTVASRCQDLASMMPVASRECTLRHVNLAERCYFRAGSI